ncbi:Aste57867_1518 [Aphanomyces stellatus]|uniref:Aste57867_1518 protein n=1 Tax=Aphanomyces stellatus TaxID=120398 RepID=A0A485K5U9_9STRA|nr:hypothetical protein As57867_001517 [Aphanomyces stellatus]VFT78734.1 Aste57867_1518 [Aphanomyces stellatus]
MSVAAASSCAPHLSHSLFNKRNLIYEPIDHDQDAQNVDDMSALFTALEKPRTVSRKRPRTCTSTQDAADSRNVDSVSEMFSMFEDASDAKVRIPLFSLQE